MELNGMRKERNNAVRREGRRCRLALFMGIFLIVMMLPAAAIANDDIMDLKPNPDDPTLYEADIYLDAGCLHRVQI